MLAGPKYTKIPLYHGGEQDLFGMYLRASMGLARAVQCEKVASELLADARRDGICGIVSNLDVTTKTHKPQGEVTCRAIHATVKSSSMAPGMRLISKILRQRLMHLPHLVRDSEHLIKVLSRVKMPDYHCFVKFDIRDF